MGRIREQIAALRRKIDDHNVEIKKVRLDIQRVQLDCRHQETRTRSIMGRETVTECLECDKEL